MRRTTISLALFVSLTILAVVVSPAMAAKPQEVIAMSDGCPGGVHFNPIIHGKSREARTAVPELDDTWGNSIRIPEYGDTMRYPNVTTHTCRDDLGTNTENIEPGHIMVDKMTDPRHDPQVFHFTLTGGPHNISRSFQLQDDSGFSPYDSGPLKGGSYTVTETEACGWSLTDIILVDPDDESFCNRGAAGVTIDLDPGEEVLVIFKNTQQ
jgi:hypothetical protein